jgi:hypothetical protein
MVFLFLGELAKYGVDATRDYKQCLLKLHDCRGVL